VRIEISTHETICTHHGRYDLCQEQGDYVRSAAAIENTQIYIHSTGVRVTDIFNEDKFRKYYKSCQLFELLTENI